MVHPNNNMLPPTRPQLFQQGHTSLVVPMVQPFKYMSLGGGRFIQTTTQSNYI